MPESGPVLLRYEIPRLWWNAALVIVTVVGRTTGERMPSPPHPRQDSAPSPSGEIRWDEFPFDAEYLHRLRDRDPATLTHFSDLFYTPIRNKIRHKIALGLADDLVQDVFVVVLARIDAGEPQDAQKLPAYVFGICHKVLLRAWDKRRRTKPVDLDLSILPDAQERADTGLINKLNRHLVRGIMEKMAARDRDALHREFFLQQQRSDASREMGVTQDNLRLILCRALKRFRSDWDKYK